MVSLKLHPLNRSKQDNRYCGPAVISFLTGMSTSEAAALLRRVSGRDRIRGTYKWEVLEAFRRCGIRHAEVYLSTTMTLAGWLRASVKDRKPGVMFLIIAGRHWQLVTGRRYACGRIGEIVSIKHEKVKRRARVDAVYRLTRGS